VSSFDRQPLVSELLQEGQEVRRKYFISHFSIAADPIQRNEKFFS